ncbi:helix-turn-helix domain-containing protein [Streptomyces sp. NPDC094049]|uniref:helix-turn-helix domain-containing protein n=1 Tax=Streptomyces sp. NPDC094049 TaxID=3154987 RepID=UPI00331A416A
MNPSDPLMTLVGRLVAETDPAARYRLALALGDQIAGAALLDLVAQHGGNRAAAARELGVSTPAVHQRLNKLKADVPAGGAGVPQPQPALAFGSSEDAVDALEDWAGRRRDLDDERDVFLLGALASGVDPLLVATTTGVPVDTLRRLRPPGNVIVSRLDPFGQEIVDFARAVHARAQTLAARASSSADHVEVRIWHHAAQSVITNAAPTALMPDLPGPGAYDSEDAYIKAVVDREPTEEEKIQDERRPSDLAVTDGADAWLAATWVDFDRLARDLTASLDDEDAAASRKAFADLAAAIHHLRTTGQVPPALAGEGA